MKTKIAFYCAHSFGLYDILPLFKSYNSNDYDVYIITNKKYYPIIKEEFVIEEDKILLITDYTSRIGVHFTDWFKLLCVNENFSEFYKQRKKIKFSGLKQKVSNSFKLFNLKNSEVNKMYSKIIQLLYKLSLIKTFPINFDKVYVVTKIFNPYLITPFEDKTHLIIESWDHPAKEPILINPFVVETWNKSLEQELKQYQFYKNTIKGKPLKFRYIEEYNKNYDEKILNKEELEDILFLKNNDVAIYPMCTSSSYFAFSEELRFVKDLALKLQREDVQLYIRPYPLAPYKDVLALQEIQNVKVGVGNKITDGLEVFSKAHMLHKYLIIKYAKYVINLGTTFVFDAALVESACKIIQIKIDMNTYGDLGKYSRGVHITKYLHTKDAFEFKSLEVNMANLSYKEYLINWLNH
ncbi:hypothetical protein H9W90_01230 [Polaribacter pectinis]|uniref:Uncharacterized protein n=1 Tax=Polaribacter pectinis TaxID=2738844 RepID=A0A7G9LAX3_9FLAO|nr:hypothetical protein [Polaribacter pectinis]QNM85772.1 hypothetical protein H9W90_01230 [Polaribacter pectinis]